MIKNIKLIHIGWEKYEFTEDNISRLNQAFHYGVYQIYGSHPVYGENTLLFIGKANQTKFSDRLKERNEFSEIILNPKYIRVGMIYKNEDCDKQNWEKMIDIAGRILVRAHDPIYNEKEIKAYHAGDGSKPLNENYMIKNWGDYGLLMPEITALNVNFAYWYEFGVKEEFIR